MRHLTSDWQGDPVGDCFVRILNRNGTRPPLIWCFNARAELPAMARGLGSHQPVIALRSLHMVEPMDARRYGHDAEVAELYARILLSAFGAGLDGCAVGGNCQGAAIAAHVASNLSRWGRDVPTLITMEAQSPLPFPGRVGLIFGARSELFNPFLHGTSPEALWRLLFSDPVVEIIPGSHGEYFKEENLPSLCRAIERIIDFGRTRRLEARRPDGLSLHIVDPPPSLPAGRIAMLSVRAVPAPAAGSEEAEQVFVYFLWTSDGHGVSDRSGFLPLTIAPETTIDPVALPVNVPVQAGSWELRIFPCRRDGGPVSWRDNHARRWSIEVVPDRSVAPAPCRAGGPSEADARKLMGS